MDCDTSPDGSSPGRSSRAVVDPRDILDELNKVKPRELKEECAVHVIDEPTGATSDDKPKPTDDSVFLPSSNPELNRLRQEALRGVYSHLAAPKPKVEVDPVLVAALSLQERYDLLYTLIITTRKTGWNAQAASNFYDDAISKLKCTDEERVFIEFCIEAPRIVALVAARPTSFKTVEIRVGYEQDPAVYHSKTDTRPSQKPLRRV